MEGKLSDFTFSLACSTGEMLKLSLPLSLLLSPGLGAQAPFTQVSAVWSWLSWLRLGAHTWVPGGSRELSVPQSEGWVSDQCSLLSAALFPAGKGIFLWPGWICAQELIWPVRRIKSTLFLWHVILNIQATTQLCSHLISCSHSHSLCAGALKFCHQHST